MLQVQYRMNQSLMQLCAHTYGASLVAHPSVADQSLPNEGPWTHPPARFVDTAGVGLEEEPDGMGSYHNPGELKILQRIWETLKAGGVRPEQVGVVTPYSAQLRQIHKVLPELEAGTVNAFQGREKDVILASFVRSNARQETGFVADPRRLNVAVTRARRLFVGVGDSETLGTLPIFRRLMDAVGDGYSSAWELEES
jgi:superfamily I DNA and/or RNA helicase